MGKSKSGAAPVSQEIVDQVMLVLRHSAGPVKTIEIARNCGFSSKQEINPTLYYMQRQRLVTKVTESPPAWTLNMANVVVHSNQKLNLTTVDGSQNQVVHLGHLSPSSSPSAGLITIPPKYNPATATPNGSATGPSDGGGGGGTSPGSLNGVNNSGATESNGVSDDQQQQQQQQQNSVVTAQSQPEQYHRSTPPTNGEADRMSTGTANENSANQNGRSVSPLTIGMSNIRMETDSSNVANPVPSPDAGPVQGARVYQDDSSASSAAATATAVAAAAAAGANGYDIRFQILNVLGTAEGPMHSNIVAHAVGRRNKREINPTLFDMQRKGLLRKVQESPPLWIITETGREVLNKAASGQKLGGGLGVSADLSMATGIATGGGILSESEGASAGQPGGAYGYKAGTSIAVGGGSSGSRATPPGVGGSSYEGASGLGAPPSKGPSCMGLSTMSLASNGSNELGSGSDPESGPPLDGINAAPQLDPQELADKLLITLAECDSATCTAITLAKKVGFETKRSINPTLFRLQSKGMTAKISDRPPTWVLTTAGANYVQSLGHVVDMTSLPSVAGAAAAAAQQKNGAAGGSNGHAGNGPASSSGVMGGMGMGGATMGGRGNQGSFGAGQPGQGQQQQMGPAGPLVGMVGTQITIPQVVSSNSKRKKKGEEKEEKPQVAGLSGEMFALLNKNPVSALTEYAQSRRLPCKMDVISQTGPPHDPRFTIAVVVGNRQFPSVVSKSKKEGKREAADAALRTLIAEGEYKTSASDAANAATNTLQKLREDREAEMMGAPQTGPVSFTLTWADEIAALCHQTFNTLALQITEFIAGRKVLAALVMKKGPEDKGVVISLGTGNRCIAGTCMSLEGQTVNDSHAEVITRRGFLRFMYQQLMDTVPGTETSLFEASSDPTMPDKYRVKSHISFHLYISTAPCGDGALFSPRDGYSWKDQNKNKDTESNVYDACENLADHQPTFNSNVQGLLRTKMEGGEGTIPVEADFGGQTWDGIMRGERLRTMSCSDKIAKWNVTGMQGALLSHFLEPIYLQSVTLGYLFDHGHLARAICCRLTRAEPEISEILPPEKLFKLHHPELGRVTVYDPPRETEKTKSVSINWTIGDEKPEVTDGSKGVCVDRYGDRTVGPSATVIANASQDARSNGSPNMINGKPGSPGSGSSGIGGSPISQLCKSLIYGHYKRVCEKYNREDLQAHKSYYAAKKAASDYQRAVRAVEDAFKSAGFGTWVKKPIEEQMFR